MKKMLAAAAFLSVLSFNGAMAASTMTPDQLKAMVTDLGYQPTMDGNYYITIPDQAKAKLGLGMHLYNDGKNLLVYMPFYAVPQDKLAKIPALKLLQKNDESTEFYFALAGDPGKEYLNLKAVYDITTVNKAMLRRTIDNLVEATNADEPLANPENWTEAPAAPAAAK